MTFYQTWGKKILLSLAPSFPSSLPSPPPKLPLDFTSVRDFISSLPIRKNLIFKDFLRIWHTYNAVYKVNVNMVILLLLSLLFLFTDTVFRSWIEENKLNFDFSLVQSLENHTNEMIFGRFYPYFSINYDVDRTGTIKLLDVSLPPWSDAQMSGSSHLMIADNIAFLHSCCI